MDGSFETVRKDSLRGWRWMSRKCRMWVCTYVCMYVHARAHVCVCMCARVCARACVQEADLFVHSCKSALETPYLT